MLVLTRRIGERIYIGRGIVVTIKEINGNQVRVGIDAPPNVNIVRSELLERAALDQLSDDQISGVTDFGGRE